MKFDPKRMHRFLVDVTLLVVGMYFVLRKITDFSGSELIEDIFQPGAGNIIVMLLTSLVAYVLVAKIVLYVLDYFKVQETPSLGLPHYRCLLNNNKEIERHLCELREGKFDIHKMEERHSYDENMQIIHRNFSEQLATALKDKGFSTSDVFISLFHDKDFDFNFKSLKTFHYSSHYDPTLHDTSTSIIETNSDRFSFFAGTRAVRKKSPVICQKINKNSYDVGTEERRQSIKHYIGVPLKIDGSVIGLLNIEFHNKQFFSAVKEMKTFYQQEVQAFTYLYEYQLHKRYFFKHLSLKGVA